MPRSLDEKDSRLFRHYRDEDDAGSGSRSDIHPSRNPPKALPKLTLQNPTPKVSQEVAVAARPSVLSRLAASLNEPGLPHSSSSTSGAQKDVAARHGTPKQPSSPRKLDMESDSNILIKKRESDKKDRHRDGKHRGPESKDVKVKSSKSSSSHSIKNRSDHSLDDKSLKLKSSRSNASSTTLVRGKDDKSRHRHRHRKPEDVNARDKRKSGSGTAIPDRRSSSRDKVRSSDERNNNRRSSRHSSRDKLPFDSNSNISLVASRKSSNRLSRRSSKLKPTSSSRRSLTSRSREVFALPLETTESVGDVDTFRRFLARSGSAPGASESMIGVGYDQEIPKHVLTAFNVAVHRRTTALSMSVITLALISGSASQLRFMMAYASAHQYPQLNYCLIIMSIIIEVIAGIGYMILSRFDFSEACVEKTHSYLIFGLFLIAISNVIISAFSLDDHVCEVLEKAELDYIDQAPPKSLTNDFPL